MQSIIRRLKIGLAVVLALGLSLLPNVVFADEPDAEEKSTGGDIRLQIAPVSNRIYLSAGQALSYNMNVDNIGSKDFKFKIYASPYSVENEQYDINFDKENNRTQVSRWITFNDGTGEFKKEVTFDLAAGERQTIEYKVSVPDNVPDGGQYATIFAETVPEESEESASIHTVSRVGLIIYGRTSGNTQDAAELAEATIPTFLTTGNIRTAAHIINTGNTDLQASANITVKNVFDKDLYTVERNYDVLPETTRQIELDWEETPFIGIFKVHGQFSVLDQKYDETKIVIVLPLIFIIITIILLTILVAWTIILIKKRKSERSRIIV